ncbi:hypothetical protein ACHWQZ_G005362 [Mnemiopsis leidyi]
MSTYTEAEKVSDGLRNLMWLSVRLDNIYCINQVEWYRGNRTHCHLPPRHYACTNSGCVCSGDENCDIFPVYIYTSTPTNGYHDNGYHDNGYHDNGYHDNGYHDNRSPPLNCKMGNTVRLEVNPDNGTLRVYELMITAQQEPGW